MSLKCEKYHNTPYVLENFLGVNFPATVWLLQDLSYTRFFLWQYVFQGAPLHFVLPFQAAFCLHLLDLILFLGFSASIVLAVLHQCRGRQWSHLEQSFLNNNSKICRSKLLTTFLLEIFPSKKSVLHVHYLSQCIRIHLDK